MNKEAASESQSVESKSGLSPQGRETLEVGVGLVFRRGLLLITQRRAGDHLGGLWEFPGGKRRSTETYEDCVRRELMEELGIEVDVWELVEALTHEYPERTVHLRFHRCVWVRHEPRTLECQSYAWVSAAQLAAYTFPAADARLLEKLAGSPNYWR